MRTAGLLISLCLTASAAFAQGGTPGAATAPVDYATAHLSHTVSALHIDQPVQLDGVLDEPMWAQVAPATDFIQWEPRPGQPASARTEVRFLYDARNLYVGVWCYDPHPEGIIVNELKEDFSGQEGDGFTLFLDTLNDHRSGLMFAINPGGARRDSEIFNDGDQYNQDWDGVWDAQAHITSEGWFAEMVIPLKTMRFKTPASPEWGLNMTRRLRRLNEDSHWSPLPRRFRVFKASLAGTLRGLDGLDQGRNLTVKPYVTSGPSQRRVGDSVTSTFDFDGGVDLKYALTPSSKLDVTYRTDFSQVEADEQQVNLTRFSVFFPEKREFFLENRDLFNFGVRGGGSGGASNNLLPFFSRKIGLSAAGTPIPILGGTRVSGKTRSYDVGLVAMRTESTATTPANTFLVGRLRKVLFTNSWIGLISTNRDSTRAGDFNRVFGLDSNIQLRQKLDITSYWLRSVTPGVSSGAGAKAVNVSWRDDNYNVTALYEQVQAKFNPEVGFIRRRDNDHYAVTANALPRVRHNYIRNFTLGAGADYYAQWRGDLQTRQQDLSAGMQFHNSSKVTYTVTHNWERLAEPFAIRSDVSIPVGDFEFTQQGLNFTLDRSRRVSGGGSVIRGGFWGGDQRSAVVTLDLKPTYRLNMDVNYSVNHVTLPQGDFTTHLVVTRALYAFTTHLFLNSFVQYNADTAQVSSNVRFNFLYKPLSDLYVVFNDRHDNAGRLLDRALVVKLTRLFSF
ncbi:MAG TPA: DUF5916 domain-containing protein [Vicinamibacterales bacterium]|nr:DUF5916 domain-containing protein [Vicinamibacterales bacterium]